MTRVPERVALSGNFWSALWVRLCRFCSGSSGIFSSLCSFVNAVQNCNIWGLGVWCCGSLSKPLSSNQCKNRECLSWSLKPNVLVQSYRYTATVMRKTLPFDRKKPWAGADAYGGDWSHRSVHASCRKAKGVRTAMWYVVHFIYDNSLFFQCFCNVLMSLLPKYLSLMPPLFPVFGEMSF